ncbi:MAG: murein transglycosylase A [Bacteriovoracia bacterium]
MIRYWLAAFLFLVSSCSRAPLEDPNKLFRPADEVPALADSFPIETLRDALKRTLVAYESSSIIPSEFRFAGRTVSRADYRLALQALAPEMENINRFQAFVRENFDFYEVYGRDKWGEIFSTGYYEVKMHGSRKKTKAFSQPIYRTPADLVSIDLSAYALRYPDMKAAQLAVLEQKSKTPIWRGRLIAESKKVVPYYDRAEIERTQALAGKKSEIAWVDPIDAFFLEIQGSGTVLLPNGKSIRVGYAAQNGWPYQAIGKFLFDVIPKEQMSMQRIRQFLQALPREKQQEIFDKNPSYVFFQELKSLSLTYSGAEVTPARTIATDQVLYPKGTLGFLDVELPVFADDTALEPASWEAKPRWVFDQDTGGAIRGGGRVDLYMGDDEQAARQAGVMKRTGKLWVVAPKESFLAKLKSTAPAIPVVPGR